MVATPPRVEENKISSHTLNKLYIEARIFQLLGWISRWGDLGVLDYLQVKFTCNTPELGAGGGGAPSETAKKWRPVSQKAKMGHVDS